MDRTLNFGRPRHTHRKANLVILSSGSHNSDTSEDDGEPGRRPSNGGPLTNQTTCQREGHKDWPPQNSLFQPKIKENSTNGDTHKQNRKLRPRNGSTLQLWTLQLVPFLKCEMIFLSEQWPIHCVQHVKVMLKVAASIIGTGAWTERGKEQFCSVPGRVDRLVPVPTSHRTGPSGESGQLAVVMATQTAASHWISFCVLLQRILSVKR